ncbi:TPA: hypothetical protein ACHTPV_004630, partial [Escherichia coli]
HKTLSISWSHYQQARDNNQMHKIGKMAEAFRMRF